MCCRKCREFIWHWEFPTAQKSALISINNYIFSGEVGRMDQLGTQIRSCFDAEFKELRRLQRLLSQLRVLLRRTIFRQAGEQTVALG